MPLFLCQVPALSSMKSGLLIASDGGIQTEKWAAEKAERRPSRGGLPLKEDKGSGASLRKNRRGGHLATNIGTDSNGC